jgi:hypothetical protein
MNDLPTLKDRSLRAFASQAASPDTRSVIVEVRRPAVPPVPGRQNRDCVTAPSELLPPRLKAAVSSTPPEAGHLMAGWGCSTVPGATTSAAPSSWT